MPWSRLCTAQQCPAEAVGTKTTGLLPRLGCVGLVSQRQVPPESPRLPDEGLLTKVQAEMQKSRLNSVFKCFKHTSHLKKCLFYSN